ncbi:MAG TPA: hypothetical protein VG477_11460 [Thermoanaerobaculia bacterium]|nr:hypothetical protein [Thermoanaerobaculia bacterium]
MIRDALRRGLPWPYFLARSLYRKIRKERLEGPAAAIVSRLYGGGDLRVLWGPFAGMRYIPFASGSGLLPKLLGGYEMEIHGAVRESLARGYDRVVNVGCGEGYYAVGSALALPEARVEAYDTDPLARQRLRELARLNGVEIEARSACGHQDLAVQGRTLIVCDCEGYEKELLDPARVPGLDGADLLVELHDFLDPTISATLAARFGGSHEIAFVEAREDHPDYPAAILEPLDPEQRRLALWEGRPAGMRWAWMKAPRP